MKTPETPGLVADIGSTNARFALVIGVEAGAPVLSQPVVLPCKDFPTPGDAMLRYFEMTNPAVPPRAATLAIAAPPVGDFIKLTNHVWQFSVSELRAKMGFDHLSLINDFTAISLSLPKLSPTSWAPIGPNGNVAGARTMGVIGPGSGLGIGALIEVDGRHIPLPSEGGHVNFAAQTDLEWEITKRLTARFGRVSNERFLSGPGLVNIHRSLCEIAGETVPALTPAEITTAALNGTDARCRETLELFCALLGSAAGDLSLLLYADAIFVAGGIAPRFVEFLNASKFRARFETKGRFSPYLAKVPSVVVTEKYPGLIGAAVHLLQHQRG